MSSAERAVHAGGATAAAKAAQTGFHAGIVAEVAAAVEANGIVVVGMAVNPAVKKACTLLKDGGHEFTFLTYGGYTSMWKERLAIKMWSGWPTYPQVFAKGKLFGGASDLEAAMKDGTFKALLASED